MYLEQRQKLKISTRGGIKNAMKPMYQKTIHHRMRSLVGSILQTCKLQQLAASAGATQEAHEMLTIMVEDAVAP